jgi:hypothetical protein
MKRFWLLLICGLAAGLVGYACIYLKATSAERAIDSSSHPELSWLKKEYHLTDAEFARVAKLRDNYRPKCVEMCRRIDEQNSRVQQLLKANNNVTPEIKQALAQAAQLRVECESAMLQHFYEVSGAMPPEQGKRYLDWVQTETLVPSQMIPTRPSMSTSR